jgi:hypothetical protein
VLGEDAAALAGILVAFFGILLEQTTRSVVPDAVAAMIIGGILCVVAGLLAIETHALLLGESADPEIVTGILKIIENDPNVANAHTPLTMHCGPDEILVNIGVEFRSGTSSNIYLGLHQTIRIDNPCEVPISPANFYRNRVTKKATAPNTGSFKRHATRVRILALTP